MTNEELIQKAKDVLNYRELSDECNAGGVSAALLTAAGNVYVGVSIDAACGIGFCAEHSAIAHMVTMGESRIVRVVALSSDGKSMPPCGRCRELLYQVNNDNLDTQILLYPGHVVALAALLPERWQELWD
ncbi:MAG: cytidine deaminase [Anaerolineae bacterium]|nr:cytidine deaminase [Anaerolineae bacterium]